MILLYTVLVIYLLNKKNIFHLVSFKMYYVILFVQMLLMIFEIFVLELMFYNTTKSEGGPFQRIVLYLASDAIVE